MQKIFSTRILGSGTYSAAVVEGTGVDIRDYVGTAVAILDVGASLAGVTPTATVRLESAGTAAGVYAGVTNSGTFPTASFAGTHVAIEIETDAYSRYLRAFASLGGSSPRFPVAVTLVGNKQVS